MPARRSRSSSQLDPAFREDGKVTAGNSCPLNDGAAAVLVMSADKASELGLEPRARIITSATAAIEPEYMGVAPIGAIRKVLDRAGMTIEDVDTVELNEAFAAQVIPIMDECDIPLEKMNPHGGAIALGHPFGMTGARIMTTLLNGLETDDKTIGLETMCVAGGQGQAMLVERLTREPGARAPGPPLTHGRPVWARARPLRRLRSAAAALAARTRRSDRPAARAGPPRRTCVRPRSTRGGRPGSASPGARRARAGRSGRSADQAISAGRSQAASLAAASSV